MGLKVRVTKLFGGGGAVGMIDPKVNMQTHHGKITAAADVCELASGTYDNAGGVRKEYADKLFILYSHATGAYSFPTGDGSVVFTRSGEFPNGSPRIMSTGTAFAHKGGAEILVFGR